MSMNINRRVLVVERPRYIVPTANCFQLDNSAVPAISDGQLRLRTLWLSLDVMLYARVKRISSDAEPVALGDVMVGPTVGRVEESNNPAYKVGELLSGFWGWQDYGVSDGSRVRKLDFCSGHPSQALSAYGASAFGAYVALHELAPPKSGETVVVGTATGGLGQIAGQIAKLKGCRVVGIAGGAEKCRIAVDLLGFDACVDHRSADFAGKLRTACSQGIDVFVDTIGGKALDAVMPLLNRNARIAACGLMDTPRIGEPVYSGKYQYSMSLLNELINRRLQLRGLVVFDHIRQYAAAFHRDMQAWLAAGSVKPLEEVVNGLENAPEAFQGLFEGRNLGKLLIKVAD